MTDFLALNRAVFQSSLPTSERMVLLALIDHLPNCEPSVSRLTSWTGLCDRAIRLCIKSLVARGVVEVNMVNGKRSTYILHLCNLGNDNRGTSYRGNENRGTTCRTPRHQLPGTPAPDADEGTNKGTKEGTPLPPAPTHAPIGPVELTGLREAGVRPRPRVDYMTSLTPENWSPGEHGLAYARELGLTDTEVEERIVWTRNVSTQFRRGRTVDWWDIRFFEAVEKRAQWKLDDQAKAQQRESVNLRERVVEYRDL